jgi:hypothetical protein
MDALKNSRLIFELKTSTELSVANPMIQKLEAWTGWTVPLQARRSPVSETDPRERSQTVIERPTVKRADGRAWEWDF